MAEVGVAAPASDLDSAHPVAAVLGLEDVVRVEGGEEAGPSGAGLELRLGREEGQVAEAADVGASFVLVEQWAAERALGAVIEDDEALFGGEFFGQHVARGGREGGDVESGGGLHEDPRSWERIHRERRSRGILSAMKRVFGTVRSILHIATTPEILLMVSKIYIPILFPLTFLIALAALALDEGFGWGPLLPEPANLGLAAVSLVAGLVVVGVSYAELVTHGDGSPSPTAGRTLKLVRSGVYRWCRNPSVHGKLLGVLGVGFGLNSPSFCCILVPFLLAGSLVEKVIRQEPQLVALFGADYEAYRREVPLFIPWKVFHR